MSTIGGNPIANSAFGAAPWAATSQWVALQVGSAPLKGRQWMEIQVKGPTALALSYVNKGADGSFTTPTDKVANHVVIPANSIKVFNIGDGVTIYGRAVLKSGTTDTGSKISVVEFK